VETRRRYVATLWRIHFGNFRRHIVKNIFITFCGNGGLSAGKDDNLLSDARRKPGIRFSELKDVSLWSKLRQDSGAIVRMKTISDNMIGRKCVTTIIEYLLPFSPHAINQAAVPVMLAVAQALLKSHWGRPLKGVSIKKTPPRNFQVFGIF